MNILQISPRIPAPLHDGGAVYIYHITKSLAGLGHNMIMAAFESNNHAQDPDMLKPFCKLYSAPGHFRPYTPAAVVKSTLRRLPVSVVHRMDRRRMDAILKQISDPVDIILLEGIHCAWFYDEIRKHFPGKKIILRQSNVEHVVLSRNGEVASNPFLRIFYRDQARLMRRFEERAMRQADGVTAISSDDQFWFLKDVPELNSMVIPPGADLPEIKHHRTGGKLLAYSNWRWQPNIDGLIWFLDRVWPELVKRFPGLHFRIAGGGLPEAVRNRRLPGKVEFMGFVGDLESLRQQSTALVAPLLSGAGVKLKIIEGMASGMPVVTTSFGAEGIEMQDGVHFLLGDEAGDFCRQTCELLEKEALRNRLSENARELIREKYSWHSQAKKLEMFCHQVLNS